MSKHSSEVSRRLVLKSSLATVTLPFFVSLRPRELRAAASPVRLVLWFQPDGTMEKSDYKPSVEPFWPSGNTTDFKFAKTTAPLDEVKQHLVVVKGIDLTQTKTAGSIHGTRMINVLTGGAATSADQAMADKLNGKTKFASLELGVAPDASGNDKSRFSYRNNSAVAPEGNPFKLYTRLFGGNLSETGGGAPDLGGNGGTPGGGNPMDPTTPADKLLANLMWRRKSVLDGVQEQIASFKSRLSRDDLRRLEEHTTAIRDVENTLVDKSLLEAGTAPGDNPPVVTPPTMTTPPPGGSCSLPQLGSYGLKAGDKFTDTVSDMGKIAAVMHDLMLVALRCDKTRLVTMMYMRGSDDSQHYGFLSTIKDKTRGQHGFAHAWPNESKAPTGQEDYTEIHLWRAKLYRDLVLKMKSIDDGNGKTLLDNSLLVWFSDMGMGRDHVPNDMPFIAAGSAGGQVRPGRFLQANAVRQANVWLGLSKLIGADLGSFANSTGAFNLG